MTEPRSSLDIVEITTQQADLCVLAVTGEIDLASVDALREAVTARLRPGMRVIVDLSGVSFCDSTGLGAFVGLHRRAGQNGAVFALAGPPRRVAELITLSGVDQVVKVHESREMAIMAD